MKVDLQIRPAKNSDIFYKDIENETVLVNQDDAVVFRLNEVGGFIWNTLDGHRTIAEIIDLLSKHFEVDESVARKDTLEFITKLAKIQLIKL